MNEGYTRIDTSAEVWAVLKARHVDDLRVFASYSAPDGDEFGDPNKAVMFTEYGLNGAEYPLMGAETTWDVDRENRLNRPNKTHRYWLCVVAGRDE